MVNFTDYNRSIKARSTSSTPIKVERYPRDQNLLSDKTPKLDYLLFDFEPPAACREQLLLDTAVVTIASYMLS